MPVLYVDVLWIENFLIDAFLLWLTAWVGRFPLNKWRHFTSALLGGVYGAVLIFPPLQPLYTLAMKILFSMIMILIAFRVRRVRDFFRLMGLFYLMSVLLGGLCLALNVMSGGAEASSGAVIAITNGAWTLTAPPWWLWIVGASLALGLLKAVWRKAERLWQRESAMWKLKVTIQEVSVEMTGLVDTGNHLKDPLTRMPVIVGYWRHFRGILPQSLCSIFEQTGDPACRLAELTLPEEWQSRLRLIPYKGVGGVAGMLIAFRPDEVSILDGSTVYVTNRVLVGLNPKLLSGDDRYQAILHPEMLAV